MPLDPWTFLFEAINFMVLAIVLDRLVFRPVHRAIDGRRAAIMAERTQAERLTAEARARSAELERQLTELEARRQAVLGEAVEKAAAERRRLLAEADRESRRRLQELEQELEARRRDALAAFRNALQDLAIGLAERILREAAGIGLQEALTDRLLVALAGVPAAERDRLRRDLRSETVAELETPHDLDEPTRNRLEAALHGLAGKKIPLAVRLEPRLGSGLRLRVDGHLWDASLAGPLEEARRPPEGA